MNSAHIYQPASESNTRTVDGIRKFKRHGRGNLRARHSKAFPFRRGWLALQGLSISSGLQASTQAAVSLAPSAAERRHSLSEPDAQAVPALRT